MSAVLRWRCDMCGRESETVQEVPRKGLSFFFPTQPSGWTTGRWTGKASLDSVSIDLCSQACVVGHYQRLLDREQKKLAERSP